MRPRVLIYNNYYLPAKNYGGPTSSLLSIVDNCCDMFDFYIVAANHDFNDTKVFDGISSGWNQVGNAKVLYIDLRETYFNFSRNSQIIEEVNPDLVWMTGILVPYDKWFIASICRKRNIPYLLSPRGEVCENAIRLKHFKKRSVLLLADMFNIYKDAWYHVTSEEEKNGLIKYCKRIDKKRIALIPNIAKNLKCCYKSSSKQQGELRIVFISRIHKKKNLLFAIKTVKQLSGNVIFDIYGPIESQEYWKDCQSEMQSCPHNIRINYCGYVNADCVAQTFKKYDCFLFPTLSENYGHVIAEALSSCCPVVLSKNTTPWDDVDSVAGYCVDLNNEGGFVNALQSLLEMNNQEYQHLIDSVQYYYSKKMSSDDAVKKHKDMLSSILLSKSQASD